MEGRTTFYTYGSSIELNGKLFTVGELTADLLNLSAERYQPMRQQFVSAPMIKCKKTPRKKCSFVAERREKR